MGPASTSVEHKCQAQEQWVQVLSVWTRRWAGKSSAMFEVTSRRWNFDGRTFSVRAKGDPANRALPPPRYLFYAVLRCSIVLTTLGRSQDPRPNRQAVGHGLRCRRLLRSSAKLPSRPAGHQSSLVLPALVIALGDCRGRSGRAPTVPCHRQLSLPPTTA